MNRDWARVWVDLAAPLATAVIAIVTILLQRRDTKAAQAEARDERRAATDREEAIRRAAMAREDAIREEQRHREVRAGRQQLLLKILETVDRIDEQAIAVAVGGGLEEDVLRDIRWDVEIFRRTVALLPRDDETGLLNDCWTILSGARRVGIPETEGGSLAVVLGATGMAREVIGASMHDLDVPARSPFVEFLATAIRSDTVNSHGMSNGPEFDLREGSRLDDYGVMPEDGIGEFFSHWERAGRPKNRVADSGR